MFYSNLDFVQRNFFAPIIKSVGTMNEMASPFVGEPIARYMEANAEILKQVLNKLPKPQWNITDITIENNDYKIDTNVVWQNSFCELRKFSVVGRSDNKTPVVIVAPMSGHFATLTKSTVQTMLQRSDVYVTDWKDAADVPVEEGVFGYDDYVQYMLDIMQHIGSRVHFIAVCQPTVQVLLAAAVASKLKMDTRPKSITLIGGPVDPRINPSSVNDAAQQHSLGWFKKYCIDKVPAGYLGCGRDVYPGHLQIAGFISLDSSRHFNAYSDALTEYVVHDNWSHKHFEFYNEYLAVMDLDAAFYLETLDRVFQKYLLAQNKETFKGKSIDIGSINDVALLTIEGEKDNISPVGQTAAAHDLCRNLSDKLRESYVFEGVGHYGVFSGSRFNSIIAPKMMKFMDSLN